MTKYGDGWCPFPAPAVLAQTARTAAMDSEKLAVGHRRSAAPTSTPRAGIGRGSTSASPTPRAAVPGDDAFNADAYLSGVEKLAALGVTWLQVGLPGDSLAHAARRDRAIRQLGHPGGLSAGTSHALLRAVRAVTSPSHRWPAAWPRPPLRRPIEAAPVSHRDPPPRETAPEASSPAEID